MALGEYGANSGVYPSIIERSGAAGLAHLGSQARNRG